MRLRKKKIQLVDPVDLPYMNPMTVCASAAGYPGLIATNWKQLSELREAREWLESRRQEKWGDWEEAFA